MNQKINSAIAVASANIALIKYWGKRDTVLNLPAVGSISITLEALRTKTKVTFKKDLNQDKSFDVLVRFKKGVPVYQEKDTDFNGTSDFFCHFDSEGSPLMIEEDSRHDGVIDRIRYFLRGEPQKIEYDTTGDAYMDTVSFFKNGKLYLESRDVNKDGKAEMMRQWIRNLGGSVKY